MPAEVVVRLPAGVLVRLPAGVVVQLAAAVHQVAAAEVLVLSAAALLHLLDAAEVPAQVVLAAAGRQVLPVVAEVAAPVLEAGHCYQAHLREKKPRKY